MNLPSRGDEWDFKFPTPGEVFLWSVVAFAVALEILVVIACVLLLFGVF